MDVREGLRLRGLYPPWRHSRLLRCVEETLLIGRQLASPAERFEDDLARLALAVLWWQLLLRPYGEKKAF